MLALAGEERSPDDDPGRQHEQHDGELARLQCQSHVTGDVGRGREEQPRGDQDAATEQDEGRDDQSLLAKFLPNEGAVHVVTSMGVRAEAGRNAVPSGGSGAM